MIDLAQDLIFELLLKAFLLGVALGIFYDVIRFVKMLCGVEYFAERGVGGEGRKKGKKRRNGGADGREKGAELQENGADEREKGAELQENGADGREKGADGREKGAEFQKKGTDERKRGVLGRILTFTVTFLTDIVFWLVFGISSILLLYNVSGGIFRASIYPCMAAGLLIYYFSLGRIVLIISHNAVILLRRIARLVFRVLLVPLRLTERFFIFLYHLTIGRFVGKIKERIILSRERKLAAQPTTQDGGEGDAVNGDEGRLYRREGRISFGRADKA